MGIKCQVMADHATIGKIAAQINHRARGRQHILVRGKTVRRDKGDRNIFATREPGVQANTIGHRCSAQMTHTDFDGHIPLGDLDFLPGDIDKAALRIVMFVIEAQRINRRAFDLPFRRPAKAVNGMRAGWAVGRDLDDAAIKFELGKGQSVGKRHHRETAQI